LAQAQSQQAQILPRDPTVAVDVGDGQSARIQRTVTQGDLEGSNISTRDSRVAGQVTEEAAGQELPGFQCLGDEGQDRASGTTAAPGPAAAVRSPSILDVPGVRHRSVLGAWMPRTTRTAVCSPGGGW
jgi:hypothetical protein